jgi:hypothetical protein
LGIQCYSAYLSRRGGVEALLFVEFRLALFAFIVSKIISKVSAAMPDRIVNRQVFAALLTTQLTF